MGLSTEVVLMHVLDSHYKLCNVMVPANSAFMNTECLGELLVKAGAKVTYVTGDDWSMVVALPKGYGFTVAAKGAEFTVSTSGEIGAIEFDTLVQLVITVCRTVTLDKLIESATLTRLSKNIWSTGLFGEK